MIDEIRGLNELSGDVVPVGVVLRVPVVVGIGDAAVDRSADTRDRRHAGDGLRIGSARIYRQPLHLVLTRM